LGDNNRIKVPGKTKLAMVSYLNSKPFEFGLTVTESGANFDVYTLNPSACADMFINNTVEIALIPIGAIHDLDDAQYKIVSEYCIGCNGEVRTVCIFSNQPLEQCTRLIADQHSKTSVLLAGIILEKVFGSTPNIIQKDVQNIELAKNEAVLMIGDKVFAHENKFAYTCDLGSAWKKYTGLPFVFALWVAKNYVDISTITHLNQAFEYGLAHIDDVIKKESSENLDLMYYFQHNISYALDPKKHEALDLFLHQSKKYLHSFSG